MNASRFAARGGMLTAMSLVLLYFASIAPSGQVGLCAAAGIVPAAALSRRQVRLGVAVYLASVMLGFLIMPSKSIIFAYTAFFGPYTLLKYAIERMRCRPAEWAVKLLFCNAALALLFVLLRAGFLPEMAENLGALSVWLMLGANIVFVIYDIAFSRLIGLLRRIFPGQ